MRLACWLSLLTMMAACDPMLNMSSGPPTRQTIEGCPEAVQHLKECCPRYESFLSCTVYDNGSPDVSARQSRCLREQPCEALERTITGGSELCGVKLPGRRCK